LRHEINKNYDALMIRSGTQVTEEIINSSSKLELLEEQELELIM